MDLYPTLVEARVLRPYHCQIIAQALHVCVRNRTKQSDIMPFVQQMITDIRAGKIPHQPWAFVHFLGIYKETKRFSDGMKLWLWVVEQDQSYISSATYGAALELLAFGGLADLPALEIMFSEALKRFPGTFAEYHASPNAIVPDRSQRTIVSEIPTALLQGILTARMLARDWKQAYLALDTVLRLYPTQTPPRFFELFMTERPITEAYTSFTTACRAGTALSPKVVTNLLSRLHQAIPKSSSLAERMLILRAVANALYAYQEAGGKVQSIHVAVFIRCFGQLIPEKPAGDDYEGDSAVLRDAAAAAAHEILRGLYQAGFVVESPPFAALMTLAGQLRVSELFTTTLRDAKNAQVDLSPIERRSMMMSASALEDEDLIKELWNDIVSKAEIEGSQLSFQDWSSFAKACTRAGCIEYLDQQLSALSHTTDTRTGHYVNQIKKDAAIIAKESGAKEIDTKDFEYMDPTAFNVEMEGLKQQMKNVEAVIMSGQPLDLQQTPFYMHIDPNTSLFTSSNDVRSVYDDFTTDPHQPPPVHDSTIKPALSSTGIPFNELRFQNWITVHELMAEAEAFETSFQADLSQAIAAKKHVDVKEKSLLLSKNQISFPESRDELKERIKELRRVENKTLSFRKVTTNAQADRHTRASVKRALKDDL